MNLKVVDKLYMKKVKNENLVTFVYLLQLKFSVSHFRGILESFRR